MLAGHAATKICFQNPPTIASLLPSNLDGSTLPPSGEPNFFVDIADSTNLNIFQFHVDFTKQSSFTGPILISVANFSENMQSRNCPRLHSGATARRKS